MPVTTKVLPLTATLKAWVASVLREALLRLAANEVKTTLKVAPVALTETCLSKLANEAL